MSLPRDIVYKILNILPKNEITRANLRLINRNCRNRNNLGNVAREPLHNEINTRYPNIPKIQWKIKHGANIHKKHYGNNSTPLHIAARRGHPRIVSTLLAAGAKLNSRNLNGMTPLMKIAEENPTTKGQRAVATMLLKAGANKNARKDARTLHGIGSQSVTAKSIARCKRLSRILK